MADSIHLARWLSQFNDSDIKFTVFPSKRFKYIHPKLIQLIKTNSKIEFGNRITRKFLRFSGYLDFLFFELIPKDFRARHLKRLVERSKFDYLHALEIQGAGYISQIALKSIEHKPKFILTNWGSDIFYFQSIPDHLERIKSALKVADLYSAECKRDYLLAKLHGFSGQELPCIPNAGGFDQSEFSIPKVKTSQRTGIVVKTYGGRFGRGNLAIEAVARILPENPNITVFFYSVTKDLEDSVSKLKTSYPKRVDFSILSRPLTHEKLREIFLKSRIYIGCSISDGISTSFLEALAYGAYPIQTNTSCADEWLDKGAKASLVSLEPDEINAALETALNDNDLVDLAFSDNLNVVREELTAQKINEIANRFYIM